MATDTRTQPQAQHTLPYLSSQPALDENTTENSASAKASPEVPVRQVHGWKWALSYSAMLSSTFLFAIDNTIVANIQPAIINAFGHIELLPWVGTGFALGSMAILPWGKALGVFSIRPLYLFNLVIFEICSVLCGAAPNMAVLIVARVVSGLAGSGMYVGTLTYVSLTTSMKERPLYLAGSTAMWGLGTVLGPVVGGAFADSPATWRWGFYINIVIAGVFAPAYICLLPSIDPQPGKSLLERCKMMDWPMTVAFLGGSTCLTMAICFGGVMLDWTSPAQIVLWVLSGALLVVTLALAKFHPGVAKENRLYPAHFFRKPLLMNLQLQVFLSSGIVLTIAYYIPLFFQFARDDGPLNAGIRLLPLIVSMVILSMVNGFFLPKLSLASPWYIAGSTLALIGTALMYTIDESTDNARIYGYTTLIGTGTGCYIVAGFGIIQSLVSSQDMSNAISAMTIAQVLGSVFFFAVSGSVFTNTAVQNMASALPNIPKADVAQLVAGTSSAAFKAMSEADQRRIIPQIASALSNIWLIYLAAATLSFVCSWFLWTVRLL